jgi:hypothetical protein
MTVFGQGIQQSSKVCQKWQKLPISGGSEDNKDNWRQVNKSGESIVARYNSGRDPQQFENIGRGEEREGAGCIVWVFYY